MKITSKPFSAFVYHFFSLSSAFCTGTIEKDRMPGFSLGFWVFL